MTDDTLACGMYQLEHAAMCDISGAAAVLAHIKRLEAEVERLTAAQPQPIDASGPCSKLGGCTCDGDGDEDTGSTPGGYRAARGVLHRGHDAEPPESIIRKMRDEDGDAMLDDTEWVYHIQQHTHTLRDGTTA